MRSPLITMLAVVLMISAACKPKASKAPDWIASAPAGSISGISGQASWIIQNQQFQTVLAKFPRAEQILDLFLKRAHISPAQETGRISFYLIGMPQKNASGKGWQFEERCFLLQLGGFSDPRSLEAAIADSFPAEGSLRYQGQDCTLHVVLDFNQVHVRVMLDPSGHIWIGDLYALDSLAKKGVLPSSDPICLASGWTTHTAPFQGFIQPDSILQETLTQIPGNMASEIPRGVQGLAWSVTPGSGPRPLHLLELALAGSPEGINRVTPWLQRLVAFMTSLQDSSGQQAPEILKEKKRVSFRARFSQEQLNAVMTKIGQPSLNFGPTAPKPSP